MQRRQTSQTQVGNIAIGSDNPIRVQSMTTTNTNDTEACVKQAIRIIGAGGELVRLTTQGVREAENMKNVSLALRNAGYATPLVADVHFNAKVADVAALNCEKVRINPGNYVDPARTFRQLEYTDAEYAAELQRIEQRLRLGLAPARQRAQPLHGVPAEGLAAILAQPIGLLQPLHAQRQLRHAALPPLSLPILIRRCP